MASTKILEPAPLPSQSLMTTRTPNRHCLSNGRSIACVTAYEAREIYNEIFVSKCYDGAGIEYRDDACVVDIGANIGIFMMYVCERNKNIRYHGCEPIPDIYSALQENAKEISGHDIRLFNFGVSNRGGEAQFNYLPHNPGCSNLQRVLTDADREQAYRYTVEAILHAVWPPVRMLIRLMPNFAKRWLVRGVQARYGKIEVIRCKLQTLSQWLNDEGISKVDLLKVDAEHAEVDILSALPASDWERIEQIIVECHYKSGEPYEKILSLFREHGFSWTEVHNSHFKDYDDCPMLFARRGS